MTDRLILWLFAVGLILVAIAMVESNGATEHPLLIDAKAPSAITTCPQMFVPHPCHRAKCGSPQSRIA